MLIRHRLLRRILALLVIISISIFSILGVQAQEPYANTVYAVYLDIISYPADILSSSANGSASGHSFIVVHNSNSYSIKVGHMTVPSRSAVTISTFGNRTAHKGVWYNVEGYYSSVIEAEDIAKLSTGITQAELTTLNYYINNYDAYEMITNNCSHFSMRCWNAVSDITLTGGTPLILYNSIKAQGGVTSGIDVPSKTISNIAYQTSTSIVYDSSGANSE